MSGSVNKVILVGNLGRDPDVRHTNDGKPVVNLSVATTETWRDRNTSERRERTEWHRVVIFSEGLGRVAQQYLRKGSKVYLEGELRTRKWTDQQGAERYSTEVVLSGFNGTLTMLDSRASRDAGGGGGYGYEGDPGPAPADQFAGGQEAVPVAADGAAGDLDDDIPF